MKRKPNDRLVAARLAIHSPTSGVGLSRAEVAERVRAWVLDRYGEHTAFDETHLGKLERGEIRWPREPYRAARREILHAATDAALGFSRHRSVMAAVATQPSAAVTDEDDAMERRQFTLAAVVVAMGMPLALRDLLTRDTAGASSDELDVMASSVAALEATDAMEGGGAALDVAVAMHHKVAHWLARPPGDYQTSSALQRLYCDLGALVAWLAYDAGEQSQARQYATDAMATARLAAHLDAELRAMNTMCLLLSDAGRPQEALQCAQQAQSIADRTATPRTVGLLHVRTARTYAKLGDSRGYGRQWSLAEERISEAAEAPQHDDPPWVRFLNPSELLAASGGSYLLLGDTGRAMSSYRSALDCPDPSHDRNVTSRSVWLADAALRHGDVTEAADVALRSIPGVARLASARIGKRLHRLRNGLDPYVTRNAKALDFADAYDATFRS